jgi:hypothetical protein
MNPKDRVVLPGVNSGGIDRHRPGCGLRRSAL